MADQSGRRSNLAKIRELVDKLADSEFRARPDAEEFRKLLGELDIDAPKNLADLLAQAPDAKDYRKLRDEIDAFDNQVISPDIVVVICKLGPPPAFGLLCPVPWP